MAARSIASLTVSFGLVAIPVKLYSATRSSGSIHFNMLHKKDGSRLKQQYVCLKEGVVVEREDIVKGYEFAKDQYVMFTPEEIKALEEVGTRSIDVQEFVPLASVDPVYFNNTYYLAPDKGGAKPYTLFASVLRETQRCAVGRWATRGREYVVILRPMGNALALHQLHFAPEVLPISDLEIEDTKIKDAELKLAQQLVEQQTSDRFEPTAYTDEVKARIEAAIQRKVEGEQITLAEAPPAADGKVIDLMEALRASLKRNTTTTTARVEPVKLGERKPPKRVVKKGSHIPQGLEPLTLAVRRPQMQSYGVGEVERMLHLSRGTIRGFISAGFVNPTRGPRREYRFSFQDLVILRAARALVRAKVPPRRIGRSLSALRRQLPASVPLTGLTICAVGNEVVVRKGANRWKPDSGQYLLELDVSVADDTLQITEIKRHTDAAGEEHAEVSVETWFERGLEAEEHDIEQALKAYEQVRKLDAQHVAARINLGRLHHEAGRLDAAHEVYREALRACEPDATLFFNFGVLLEDSSRYDEAIEAYQQALAADPDFADAHYNLARLYEVVGKPQHAIRHLGEYRRLLR